MCRFDDSPDGAQGQALLTDGGMDWNDDPSLNPTFDDADGDQVGMMMGDFMSGGAAAQGSFDMDGDFMTGGLRAQGSAGDGDEFMMGSGAARDRGQNGAALGDGVRSLCF